MMVVDSAERDQHFDKIIAALRQEVNEIKDFRISMGLAAAIASITHDIHDISLALEKARGHGSLSARAEAMAILVKTLAEARHFAEAREVASEMRGMDAYWTAESRIWIARFSGDEQDIKTAEGAVRNIHSPDLRNEAKADMEDLVRHRHHHTGVRHAPQWSFLQALKRILDEMRAFEDSHMVRPKHASAHLRLRALEIIYRLHAEALK